MRGLESGQRTICVRIRPTVCNRGYGLFVQLIAVYPGALRANTDSGLLDVLHDCSCADEASCSINTTVFLFREYLLVLGCGLDSEQHTYNRWMTEGLFSY